MKLAAALLIGLASSPASAGSFDPNAEPVPVQWYDGLLCAPLETSGVGSRGPIHTPSQFADAINSESDGTLDLRRVYASSGVEIFSGVDTRPLNPVRLTYTFYTDRQECLAHQHPNSDAITPSTVPEAAPEPWYLAHYGGVKCWPLIDFYAHAAIARRPEDFIAHIRALGANPEVVIDRPDIMSWRGTLPGDDHPTYWVFFRGMARCLEGMKGWPAPSR